MNVSRCRLRTFSQAASTDVRSLPLTTKDPADYSTAIAKLFIRYAGQEPEDTRYAMATGWLIRDDILVTAGHCAFDWTLKDTEGLGRAVEVKAYIGYHGKASVNEGVLASGSVQFRYGVKVVTTEGWLKGGSDRNNDVAFVQLNRPFDDITPFEYQSTPLLGSEVIGVVGYPADRIYKEESGGQMYEEFRQTRWNLDHSAGKLLEYRINTFRGKYLVAGHPPSFERPSTKLISQAKPERQSC
jgi:V8-like Glu-specific endopeptidase